VASQGLSEVLPGPLDRLVTLPSGQPEFTLGYEAVFWAAKYLRHPNGPLAGKPWTPVPSQLEFMLWWYSLDPVARWLYEHGVRRLSKGAGKSPHAGVLCLIELCAPVRFSHFCERDPDDPRTWGGVRGKPVDMPLVQIAATSASQTANTNRMVRALMPKNSRVVRDHGLDPGKTITYKDGGGQMETITSSASAAEGALTTFAVLDESEHWRPANGGIELAAVMDRNLAKSSSRAIETCNAWEPGAGSVAEATWDAWVAQEEGRTRSKSRILYDARVAPPDTDLADDDSLRAGIAAAYGDCFWVDQQTIMDRILSLRTAPDVARRFYLNQPVASQSSWVTPQEWAVLADPTVIVGDGDEIVMFFDGSLSNDATALVGCHVETGHVFVIGIWEPAAGPDGVRWHIPADEVDATVAHAFARWTVVGFFGDVKEWESFTKVEWPRRYADQLAVMAVPGGRDPQSIAWDMRSHVHDFTMACEMTFTEITESKPGDLAFTHDGDSRLARHVINARRHPNRSGVSISKETRSSPRKIDAAVCMIGARMVRRLYLASEQAKKPAKSRSGVVRGYR
jgi:hypothetical protein